NAMSRKSRLSMPRSLMAWLSGLIFSRGMSQVSEMILATVSKVEDISKSLIEQAFRRRAAYVRLPVRAPPCGHLPREKVGWSYSEDTLQVQCRLPEPKRSIVEQFRWPRRALSKAPAVAYSRARQGCSRMCRSIGRGIPDAGHAPTQRKGEPSRSVSIAMRS